MADCPEYIPRTDFCESELDFYRQGQETCDSNYMENILVEQIKIAGAPLNIFKLLGVHEQGVLTDLIGTGTPISSATEATYLVDDAFDSNSFVWRSAAQGAAVTAGSTFIGYNFGTKLASDGGEKYAPPQPVFQHITTIQIKQSSVATTRIIQARIERSTDGGVTWVRSDVVNLPDDDVLNTIDVRPSTPAQMWRIVPLLFNGGVTDAWEVDQILMMDYTATKISNIEDDFFNENRSRDYASTSVFLKAHYDLQDITTDFSKFGIDLPVQYMFTAPFVSIVTVLGRPIVIGDIIELPSEAQYDTNLCLVKKYLEVTDTSWAAEGFTPGWKPLLSKFIAQPLIASQNTMDVIGVDQSIDNISDLDFMDDHYEVSKNATVPNDNLIQEIRDNVPEFGTDTSEINNDNEVIYKDKTYLVEDGLPPNGQPYTEADTFPVSPSNGSYHRLTYPSNTRIPTRLFQYNAIKNRWIYKETDTRGFFSSHKASMRNIMNSVNKFDLNED